MQQDFPEGQNQHFSGYGCQNHPKKMASASASLGVTPLRTIRGCNKWGASAFSLLPPSSAAEACHKKRLNASIPADPLNRRWARSVLMILVISALALRDLPQDKLHIPSGIVLFCECSIRIFVCGSCSGLLSVSALRVCSLYLRRRAAQVALIPRHEMRIRIGTALPSLCSSTSIPTYYSFFISFFPKPLWIFLA